MVAVVIVLYENVQRAGWSSNSFPRGFAQTWQVLWFWSPSNLIPLLHQGKQLNSLEKLQALGSLGSLGKPHHGGAEWMDSALLKGMRERWYRRLGCWRWLRAPVQPPTKVRPMLQAFVCTMGLPRESLWDAVRWCLEGVQGSTSPLPLLFKFFFTYLFNFVCVCFVLDFRCCLGFSLAVASRRYSLVVVHGLLNAVASLVSEHGL